MFSRGHKVWEGREKKKDGGKRKGNKKTGTKEREGKKLKNNVKVEILLEIQ